jgi:hypothetical protein
MRRQRQCPTWSGFEIDVQCQRLARHEGPHRASARAAAQSYRSWSDANPKTVELLPGTVWFDHPLPPRAAKAARFLGELTGLVVVLWWLTQSVTAAVVYFAMQVLLCVQRSHFVDVGRFTAGVWLVNLTAPRLIFGVAWMFHGEGRSAKKAGLEVVLGPRCPGRVLPRAPLGVARLQAGEGGVRGREEGAQRMSPHITVRRRMRTPRGVSLGPFRLWAVRIPQGPSLGFGRIATTDTPNDPAPGQKVAHDGNGWVLVLGGVAFSVLRCRSVPLPQRCP